MPSSLVEMAQKVDNDWAIWKDMETMTGACCAIERW